MKIKAGNIKKGSYILFKNQPHQVTKTSFMSPGKGSAFMRLKLKNVKTGNTVEFTYKSNEMVEELDVSSKKMQYLYHDANEVVFMDERTYEQVGVPIKLLSDKLDLLLPEVNVYLLIIDEQAVGVSLPPKIKLKVKRAENAVAGDTVGGAKKEIELETGLKVQAPLFIKTGETVVVDTDTKQYVGRG